MKEKAFATYLIALTTKESRIYLVEMAVIKHKCHMELTASNSVNTSRAFYKATAKQQ